LLVLYKRHTLTHLTYIWLYWWC